MELAADFAMSLPAVSQHLKVLRDAGQVSEERRARQRVYSVWAGPLREVADWVSHTKSSGRPGWRGSASI